MVVNERAGNSITGIHSERDARIPGATCARPDQGRASHAKRVSRDRKLDGGRDPVAGADCAPTPSRRAECGKRNRTLAQRPLRFPRLSPHYRPRQLRSAKGLVTARALARGRKMPPPRDDAPPGHGRRPDDGVVRALSAWSLGRMGDGGYDDARGRAVAAGQMRSRPSRSTSSRRKARVAGATDRA